jgi:hypothetical protein
MSSRDKVAARRIASERMRQFFSDLTRRLAAGTHDIWARVEARLQSEHTVTRQPTQQQQARTTQNEKEPQ